MKIINAELIHRKNATAINNCNEQSRLVAEKNEIICRQVALSTLSDRNAQSNVPMNFKIGRLKAMGQNCPGIDH
jgi:hypothetical protein